MNYDNLTQLDAATREQFEREAGLDELERLAAVLAASLDRLSRQLERDDGD